MIASLGILLSVSGAIVPAGQTQAIEVPVTLPSWSCPDGWTTVRFRLGGGVAPHQIWGTGKVSSRSYFDEWLPALFERTLVLEELDLQGETLSWIFTGPQGGFTVGLKAGAVTLTQKFWDSFGFHSITGPKSLTRHPEKAWQESSAAYTGRLGGVTVSLDHCHSLVVRLNGQVVLRQECETDIQRHQLRLSGDTAKVTGSVLSPPPAQTSVRIDTGKRHQTMVGFGGIAIPTAYAELSPAGRRQWWQMVCEYNLLIQREYPMGVRLDEGMTNWDRLDDATPHYYGDNFPNGEVSNWGYLKMVRRLGGKVFFEFWGLPLWARQDWTDEQGKVHKGVANPAVYARAMVSYCKTSMTRVGAPPDIVGVQNEIRQPPAIWHAMTLSLRQGLDEAGFTSVRIHMSDSTTLKEGLSFAGAFKASPAAWAKIDYAAAHMYDYQRCFTEPDRFDELLKEWHGLTADKPFLSTELCVNDNRYQRATYHVALSMGQLYHKNLTLTDAAAICYCWSLLNVVQPSYGATRSLCVPDASIGYRPVASSHQLRVFGAYSRRVREGMVRVEAASAHPDVLATAFVGANETATVIILNRSPRSQEVRVEGLGISLRDAELADPYHANETVARPKPDSVGENAAVVPPGAIVTLSNVPLGVLPSDMAIP